MDLAYHVLVHTLYFRITLPYRVDHLRRKVRGGTGSWVRTLLQEPLDKVPVHRVLSMRQRRGDVLQSRDLAVCSYERVSVVTDQYSSVVALRNENNAHTLATLLMSSPWLSRYSATVNRVDNVGYRSSGVSDQSSLMYVSSRTLTLELSCRRRTRLCSGIP